jgi:hypothetical protein
MNIRIHAPFARVAKFALLACLVIAATLFALSSKAADTNAPPALAPEEVFEGGTIAYTNWVEFGVGGVFIRDNKARAQQRLRTPGGAFGGIEDFHYQADVATNTVFTFDGRSVFNHEDYKMRLQVARENVGFLRFSYDEFRSWSDGDGGFDPQSGAWYPLSKEAFTLDRSQFGFEAGLTPEDGPKVTFKYNHSTREGEKSSTIWGVAHPNGFSKGLSPSFYDLNERIDSFQIDVAHTLGKTDLGGGLRYDAGKLENALKITQSPGEAGFERKITDRQGSSFDMFNVHAFTETWLTNNLMFSTAASYSDLSTDFSGSRIYGSDFDVSYAPNAQNGFGYFDLNGGSRLHEYVANLNLFYQPTPHVAIVPSLRVQREEVRSSSTGIESLGDRPVANFASFTERGLLDVRERLDIRYTGITNWVLFARGELTEGEGSLDETGGLGPIGGVGIPTIQRQTDDGRFFQKYSAGARWYPSRRVIVDVGAYYKLNAYDYDHSLDSTPNNGPNRYPAYLVIQNFRTYDGNMGLTLRPFSSVSMVSRYEFQWSTVQSKFDQGTGLDSFQSSRMTTHIVAQDVSWTPWSRLSLQAGVNYVASDAKSPGTDITQAILRAQNNYWTFNFSSTFVADDKSDVKLSYFYYVADDYVDNSLVGVPFGAGAEEHGVTLTYVRRISATLRLTMRYGYFLNSDELYGGHRDFSAHLVYSGLQYRF